VIGNSNYSALGKLRNPVNDAEDMAAALAELGFNVDKALDCDLTMMENAILRLKNRLSISANTYGFFFYAGHGVQSNGSNFLIPVSANIPSEGFLRERALSVQAVLNELNDAGNELNVVVLDACRDNPFNWGRNSGRGLTIISNQPADSIVVYATSAGSVAQDGMGRNGLFTASLLNNLKTPGLEVMEIFRRTGQEVIIASGRKQIPSIYSQYFGNAYFSRPLPTKPIEARLPESLTENVLSQPAEALQHEPLAIPFAVAPSVAALAEKRNEGGAGFPFTSVSDFKEWLSRQPDNAASAPYNAKLNLKSLTGLMNVLKDAPQKYVNLDLSGSTFTSIGRNAFEDCASLTNVIIPNSVDSIGGNAFEGTSLTSVIIPDGVTSIEDDAFKGCANLASVAIGSGVKSILNNAFNGCASLESVTFKGAIPSTGFSSLVVFPVFPGDLRAKFYAADKTNGTPGTYTRKSGSSTWTLQ
jgi:hypothetical protein